MGEKRSHDEMDAAKLAIAKPDAGQSPAASSTQSGGAAAATAGILGLPFMLPNAALMAMNTVQHTDQSNEDAAAVLAVQQQMAAALAAVTAGAGATAEGDKTDPQQQQAMQQQLQLLQLQQQQLQQMSPSELTTMAAMAHQMALGMVMMPAMMPLMMMNQNGGQGSPQAGQESPSRGSSEGGATDSLGMIGQGGDANAMPLMAAAAYGMGNDDGTPKRKRGRPPKKDVMNRPKGDGTDKALKQFPLWGYGMPMPFLPGFTPNASGAIGVDQVGAGAQEDGSSREGEDQASAQGKAGAKKKTRGTGKPRGRPRTRPRPGDIIQRVKPPAIAPANLSGMQEYLVQKLAEWKATQGGASSGDDNRVSSFGASLGDHE